MTFSDVSLALSRRPARDIDAAAKPLGFFAGFKAYHAYQALRAMTPAERRHAGITSADLPRVAARSARLID